MISDHSSVLRRSSAFLTWVSYKMNMLIWQAGSPHPCGYSECIDWSMAFLAFICRADFVEMLPRFLRFPGRCPAGNSALLSPTFRHRAPAVVAEHGTPERLAHDQLIECRLTTNKHHNPLNHTRPQQPQSSSSQSLKRETRR